MPDSTWKLATLGGGGGHFDATPLTTINSVGVRGYFFVVDTPVFPDYPFASNPGSGFWIAHHVDSSTPSGFISGYYVENIPDDVVYSQIRFQFYRILPPFALPIPTPNNYIGTFLTGRLGAFRKQTSNVAYDVLVSLGISPPFQRDAGSLFTVVGDGTGGDPFGAGTPGEFQAAYYNPGYNGSMYWSGNPAGHFYQDVNIQIDFGIAQDTGIQVGINGVTLVTPTGLNLWSPQKLYFLYQELGPPNTGGDGGGTGSPPSSGTGVDILHNRKGFFLSRPSSSGLMLHNAENAFTRLSTGLVVDADKTADLPCLNTINEAEGISCLYRKGKGIAADPAKGIAADPFYWTRRHTLNEGETWLKTLGSDGKEVQILVGKAWVRELHGTHRSRERWEFYNDGSGKGSDSKPDGTGLIVVDIYDELGHKIGTFPADGKGILAKKADNAMFGVGAIRGDQNDDLRVWFFSGGALYGAFSIDEGRTWGLIPQTL
jgi:hypothetical protein